ncbi:hypothetical protein Cni_G14542 [Canna indica]|uniref:Uncharacterized protein n=1 Tax=Canna indica TaxID=4628 RepID=A0AAQ3QAR7_9LILI|nr:hypothetical protein Cni_G14542 [Canna indica]
MQVLNISDHKVNMDHNKIEDTFNLVTEKLQNKSSKILELVDQIGQKIECATTKMQSIETANVGLAKSIFLGLETALNEISPIKKLKGLPKDLNEGLAKYVRLLEKSFRADISESYQNLDFDAHLVNQIIAIYFYRDGLFDLGDCFVREANDSEAAALKAPFLQMYGALEALKSRNLEPALNWASEQSEWLFLNGSDLKLTLHQLQYLELLQNDNGTAALGYSAEYLTPYAAEYPDDVSNLLACLLWKGKLHESPYAEYVSPKHWDTLPEKFKHQFCSLLGESYQGALGVAIVTGFRELPMLVKLQKLTDGEQDWESMHQLPIPIELETQLLLRSVVVCPGLKEKTSNENPPLLMPCGHVLSKKLITLISGNTRCLSFWCPCCKKRAKFIECRQLHF